MVYMEAVYIGPAVGSRGASPMRCRKHKCRALLELLTGTRGALAFVRDGAGGLGTWRPT